MRIASMLVPAVLLAASAAWADPAPPAQSGATAQTAHSDAGDRDAARSDRQKADGTQADANAPRRWRSHMPEFRQEQTSESDCYYVFGELRCDRVPNGPHRTESH